MKKEELFLEDLKQIEIEILDYVVALCKKHGLRYFLDSGTLLGAVRHKGFIPWDDDIDITMPRKDYEKFCELFPKESKYRLLSIYNTKDCIYPFAKVVDTTTELYETDAILMNDYGVYIDIFPIDGLPSGESKRKRFQEKVWFYRILHSYSIFLWSSILPHITSKIKYITAKLKYTIAKLIGTKRILNKIDKVVKTYDADETGYGSTLVISSNRYRTVETDVFAKTIELEFEGKKYAAPHRYDDYLTILYGNYMQLPPKEKQVSNHSFKAYRKEK